MNTPPTGASKGLSVHTYDGDDTVTTSNSTPANFDDLFRQIEADELQDRLDESPLLSPREYAKLRGKTPQNIYYYIRTKKLAVQLCNCGRKCINVVEADEFFASISKDKPQVEATEE